MWVCCAHSFKRIFPYDSNFAICWSFADLRRENRFIFHCCPVKWLERLKLLIFFYCFAIQWHFPVAVAWQKSVGCTHTGSTYHMEPIFTLSHIVTNSNVYQLLRHKLWRKAEKKTTIDQDACKSHRRSSSYFNYFVSKFLFSVFNSSREWHFCVVSVNFSLFQLNYKHIHNYWTPTKYKRDKNSTA